MTPLASAQKTEDSSDDDGGVRVSVSIVVRFLERECANNDRDPAIAVTPCPPPERNGVKVNSLIADQPTDRLTNQPIEEMTARHSIDRPTDRPPAWPSNLVNIVQFAGGGVAPAGPARGERPR